MDWDKMVDDMGKEISEYTRMEHFHMDLFDKLLVKGFPEEAILPYVTDQMEANGVHAPRLTQYFHNVWRAKRSEAGS